MIPETRYAVSGDVNITYKVIGDGPVDIVMTPGCVPNVESVWEDLHYARFVTQLGCDDPP
jgi:hypothetical protein